MLNNCHCHIAGLWKRPALLCNLCRKGGFPDATFYMWRAKVGGMEQINSGTAATQPLPAIKVSKQSYACIPMPAMPTTAMAESGEFNMGSSAVADERTSAGEIRYKLLTGHQRWMPQNVCFLPVGR